MITKKVIKEIICDFDKKSLANYIKGSFIVKNVNNTQYEKNCLLLYIPKAFSNNQNLDIHQNYRQCRCIAKCVGELGYNVDVATYSVSHTYFDCYYDLVIDSTGGANNVYYSSLKDNSKRLAYLTTSNPSYSNEKSIGRSRLVTRKKGVYIPPRVFPELSKEIETFDGIILIGNETTLHTYSEYNMPKTVLVDNSGYEKLDPIRNDKKNRDCFLYFASSGQIHKGLNILLDIFSEKGFPFKLIVCGNYQKEELFCEAYHKELYETDNIEAIGFVDISSDVFKKIAEKCSFALFPSCAEGMCGAVLTVMSAGIIPICSKECGVDETITFEDCECDTIKRAIYEYAGKSAEWTRKEQQRVLELVKDKYSFGNYEQNIRQALYELLGC